MENRSINEDKFTFKEGELKISDSLCTLCIFNNMDDEKVCSRYKEGKPPQIIESLVLCPKMVKKNAVISLLTKEEQLELGANLLNISIEEANKYSRIIEEPSAIYINVPTKGGCSLILGEDGQVLYANSSISFNDHLEEYKNGKRTPLEAFDALENACDI